MKALCWHGKGDVRVDTVPDPKIEDPRDAIVRITSTGICGSDLHLFDGFMPTMESGRHPRPRADGRGRRSRHGSHEAEEGRPRRRAVHDLLRRAAGSARRQLYSCCDTSNPNAEMARKAMGQSPAGLFGFSHMLGGFPGGQAEYLRVPFADVGPFKIESDLPDEKVLFLSDIFPTGYMAAENCGIEPGDTVAVWGCGPVAQFAIQERLDARRRAGDRHRPRARAAARWRRSMARPRRSTSTKQDVYDTLQEMTKGRGPDRCIDAVGCEAHGTGAVDAVIDKAKAAVHADHRSAARPARGDHVLPQGRHDLGPRRLRRLLRTRSRSAR